MSKSIKLDDGNIVKVGDRVLMRMRICGIEHHKQKIGFIEHIDGSYISVRPRWCTWQTECYPNELKKVM
jgi:hypothetical protein